MTKRRSDTEEKLHFRSDRIACENGLFFLTTREGGRDGPYKSRNQAEVAAALFIRDQLDPTRTASRQQVPDQRIYRYADRSGFDRRSDKRRLGERRSMKR